MQRRWVDAAKVPPAHAGRKLLEGVERTFAWLARSLRPTKDFEAAISGATVWLFLAHIRLLTRKIAHLR